MACTVIKRSLNPCTDLPGLYSPPSKKRETVGSSDVVFIQEASDGCRSGLSDIADSSHGSNLPNPPSADTVDVEVQTGVGIVGEAMVDDESATFSPKSGARVLASSEDETPLPSVHEKADRAHFKSPGNLDPAKPAANIRSMLSTGLLEGVPVVYKHSKQNAELPGFIKDLGYACGCKTCNYSKVQCARNFERHAGATSKHQNNHIFLENGKSLHVVIKEVQDVPLNNLDAVMERVIGSRPNFERYMSWKNSISKNNLDRNPTDSMFSTGCQMPISDAGLSTASSTGTGMEGPDSQFLYEPVEERQPSFKFGPSLLNGSTFNFDEAIVTKSSSASTFDESPLGVISSPFVSSIMKEFSSFYNDGLPSSDGPLIHYKSMEESGEVNVVKPARAGLPHKGDAHVCPIPLAKNPQAEPKRKGFDLHQSIFKDNGLPDGSALAYWHRGKKQLEGFKMRNGIFCNCCNSEISPSQFETHAGFGARRQPYHNIYTSNGLTLHELSISLSKGANLQTVCSDNECSICGEGGGLIFCNGCPKAFHAECLEIQGVLQGDWYCPYCRDSINSIEDPMRATTPIRIRSIRVIEIPMDEIGGCAVCRSPHYSQGVFNSDTVMLCDQCEKEFHVGCLKNKGLCDLKELPRGNWFCSCECAKIHATLQALVSCGVNAMEKENSSDSNNKEGVNWQLLSGKVRTTENKLLLSKAAAIFRNGFIPILASSGCDLVPAMVYGRSIPGYDFSGTYCVILFAGSIVVSAGVFRIFGKEIAELPLVATSERSRRKGHLRQLFSIIEMLLSRLSVESIMLPSTEDIESMWTNKFGFTKMSVERLRKYSELYPLTMFKGTVMLEKPIVHSSS